MKTDSTSNDVVSAQAHALRRMWREAGGDFHGPNVETGTMPEAKLLPFLRDLAGANLYSGPLARYCPECGHLGEVHAVARDCCPDGSAARYVPQRFAELCRQTFLMAIGKQAEPVAVHQYRSAGCADWYDGFPDTEDGKKYETRTLYKAAQALAVAQAEPLCWVFEDELPASLTTYAYNKLFAHSKVDGVRMFPVFGPQAQPADALDAKLLELVRSTVAFAQERGSVLQVHIDGMAELLAERNAMAAAQTKPADALDAETIKKAARYDWLRDENAYAPEEALITGGEELDELCDAGIAEKKGGQR